ncbi:hypothetical protein DESC_700243 [Desulfosarcina cetonica]|nr:hypothetical protein DESC_700243 [Desulfosarcina cetonica]
MNLFFLAVIIGNDRSDGRRHLLELLQHLPIQTVAGPWPLHFTSDQTCSFEYFQMLADCRLRQREDLNDLPANALVDRLEISHDSNPGRVSQRFADVGEGFGILRCVVQWRHPLIVIRRYTMSCRLSNRFSNG